MLVSKTSDGELNVWKRMLLYFPPHGGANVSLGLNGWQYKHIIRWPECKFCAKLKSSSGERIKFRVN